MRSGSCHNFPEDAELLTCITRGLSLHEHSNGKPQPGLCNSRGGRAASDPRHQWRFSKSGLSTMSSDAWTRKPVISKPLSLPRACLSARIAENLGQSVLSRVQLLSFVYFYILKTTELPRLLLPSSLLANFNTQSPS